MKYAWMVVALATVAAQASSNISVTNHLAHAANPGWIDARADATNGAVIGEYVCSGNMYGANVGWINLGVGAPTNGIRYGNASSNDFGVNHDGVGNLRGFAYGANIGWINFESNGNPRVNLLTGNLDGYAYGANVGWISLSNAFAFVQADTLRCATDADADGIPDAWEIERVGSTNILGGAGDSDADGVSDRAEYLADTDPIGSSDFLHIALNAASNATQVTVAWPSRPTRLYKIEASGATTNDATWTDSGLGIFAPDGTNTTRTLTEGPATTRFYRVLGVRPYGP